MDKPTIFVSAGGTGGGIYPALTIAEALRRVAPRARLHYIGSTDGMERTIVPREKFAGYHEIESGPLRGVELRRAISSVYKIIRGIFQSWRLAGRLRPDALILTGGWATFPVAVACWLRRVPIAVYVPDIEPALVIRAISRLSRLVMTPTPESARFFARGVRHRVMHVGYPLREAITAADRETGLRYFNLEADRKTLLVWGGSRGARSINQALGAILPDLLADGLQIIHISGDLDWPNVEARRSELPADLQARYHAVPYLRDEMGLALAAADVAVSRAGASILGEYPHFGLPSILIPLTFAWRHQRVNADWLAERGAALRLDDDKLPTDLLPTIRALLNDPARLGAMRAAARALAGDEVASKIAEQVLLLAKKARSG